MPREHSTTVYFNPVYFDGKIFVNSETHLYSLDGHTGEYTARPTELNVPVQNGPGVSGRYAVFGSPTGNIFGHDLITNLTAFRYDLPGSITMRPCGQENAVFVADLSGNYIFFDTTKNGKPYGRGHFWGGVTAVPGYNRLATFVPCKDGSLYALNTNNGKDLWVYPHEQTPLEITPIASNRSVILPLEDGGLIAINAIGGDILWKAEQTFGRAEVVSPGGDVFYVDNETGLITVISSRTGKIIAASVIDGASRIRFLNETDLVVLLDDSTMVQFKPL